METVGRLKVDSHLFKFVEEEVLPGTGIEGFWESFEAILKALVPVNKKLLDKREELQSKVNAWHQEKKKTGFDLQSYKSFLYEIGYLLPEGDDFSIETCGVDEEICAVAGPQLVVPISNTRYALNAANARWGSLYDALYGTDAIAPPTKTKGYDPKRGSEVVAWAKNFLDQAIPLKKGKHSQVVDYLVEDGLFTTVLDSGERTTLVNAKQYVGRSLTSPRNLLLKNNGLHLELVIDKTTKNDKKAGLADVIMEAAVTTICDFEDSVAAVDAMDKVDVYRAWLGLMKRDLSVKFEKGGKVMERKLTGERLYDNGTLPGTSLLLCRNVGHLMTTGAILLDGEEIPEGIMDGMMTGLIGIHDKKNSRHSKMYVVKPKMHGPEEVAFTCDLFTRIEVALHLPRNTMLVGIMDEERRTSLNLKECIRAAKQRLVFINTGFLDRTADEIFTSLEAGVAVTKTEMKKQPWLEAYENNNVNVGLRCGLSGRGQIGKGMWAMPDLAKAMLTSKIGHPRAGANCSWVPSPTLATLHATHYHQVSVHHVQQSILNTPPGSTTFDDLLCIPITNKPHTAATIQLEIENNCQGILGYVARWVEQGVGCSKVPDVNDVGLMEDRATLRISSQILANWLHHNVCGHDQVLGALKKMAVKVDQQNQSDSKYIPMAPNYEQSVAFQAACELVFKGKYQPSGYTEPILHAKRVEAKAKQAAKGIQSSL